MDIKTYLMAFIIGGAICTVGQLLLSYTRITAPRILVAFVVTGVIAGAIGVYEPLVRLAGAGATVPITGFGYTLFKGAAEGVKNEGLIGAFTGGIKATAGGVAAAIFFGAVNAMIFKPKTKE